MKRYLPPLFSMILLFPVILGYIYFLPFNHWDFGKTVTAFHLEGESVVIKQDSNGINHIFGTTKRDAFFALGYLHWMERGFQMEICRSGGKGELYRLLGDSAENYDRQSFLLDFPLLAAKGAAQLDHETRDLLKAYTAGINEGIIREHQPSSDFRLLNHKGTPWDIEDIFYVFLFMTRQATDDFSPPSSAHHDLTFRGRSNSPWVNSLLFNSLLFNIPRMTEGSNSWVIGASKTMSGKAELAADPHMPITLSPGLWYPVALHYGNRNAVGLSIAGVPGLAMGRNNNTAWSFTASQISTIRHGKEIIHPLKENTILGPQGPEVWEPVYGNSNYGWTALRGPRGVVPIDYDLWEDFNSDNIELGSIQWTGTSSDPAANVSAYIDLMDSGNTEELSTTLNDLTLLPANFLFADRQDRIGMKSITAVDNSWTEPLAYIDYGIRFAQDSNQNSEGTRQIESEIINPGNNWAANCNNLMEGIDDSALFINDFKGRYEYLTEMFALFEGKKLPEDFSRQMQLSNYDPSLHLLAQAMAGELIKQGREKEAAELSQWDGIMSGDSTGASLALYYFLNTGDTAQRSWGTQLHDYDEYADMIRNPRQFITLKWDSPGQWENDIPLLYPKAPGKIRRPLQQTQYLRQSSVFSHLPVIGTFLPGSRKYSWQGGASSLNISSSYLTGKKEFEVYHGTSARLIMNMADNYIELAFCGSMDEEVFSGDYQIMLDQFQKNRYSRLYLIADPENTELFNKNRTITIVDDKNSR